MIHINGVVLVIHNLSQYVTIDVRTLKTMPIYIIANILEKNTRVKSRKELKQKLGL
jgi:hypothetical protein